MARVVVMGAGLGGVAPVYGKYVLSSLGIESLKS